MRPDYLSYTQLSTYLECPLRYRLRYVDGIEDSEGTPAALVFGRAIHQALAGYYTDAQDGPRLSLC